MIPYGRQDINEDDIEAVIKVLHSDFLTQGPAVPHFEHEIAQICQVQCATAVTNATSALHLCCLALDLGPGDWLWTSPITFVASANCALYCGARVDFVDIDPKTYTLCPQALEEKLIQADKEGRLPKIVVPVHFAGQSCDMVAIHALSQRYGFKIIEDAAHAIGATYQQQPVGNCRYSDACIFSFHPVKIITSGEGGMIVTNSESLHDRVNLLRSHGITRQEQLMTEPSHGPWYYQQIALGYNCRMTDIQAALGTSQLSRLEQFLDSRRYYVARYNQALHQLPLITPYLKPGNESAWHLYVVRVPTVRQEVFNNLRQKKIGVNVHYIPVHLQPYYRQLGFYPGQFPEAEQYYEEAVTLPLFAAMTEKEQDEVIAACKQILG